MPFFVLGVALIAVLIAIFKYNDEDKGEADESLTATVDDSSAVESANNIALSLSDEEVYNIDLMQANGVAMIDPISYDSMADVIEDTMVEFGVDESQISLEFINYQTGESYTVNENNFQTAASTIKLPLSVIYVDAIDEGTIDWDTEVTYTYADYEEGDGTITAAVASGTGQATYTIEDLIANALMYSDNTATNMLIRYYNELYGSETYKTSIASSVDVAIDEAFYSDNVVSAELLSAYYDLLATVDDYQPLVDYLLDASPDRLFTTYVNSSLMANKYGNYGTALNDGGIYYENDEAQYSLVVLTDGLSDGTGFLENLNLRVNQYYRANYE